MPEENKETTEVATNEAQLGWFRTFIKNNKVKVTAVISIGVTCLVNWVAGDPIGGVGEILKQIWSIVAGG